MLIMQVTPGRLAGVMGYRHVHAGGMAGAIVLRIDAASVVSTVGSIPAKDSITSGYMPKLRHRMAATVG